MPVEKTLKGNNIGMAEEHLNGTMSYLTVNGASSSNGVDNKELEKKLSELTLKGDGEKPVYLGDDDDYSSRPPRSAMSPSPRQDERSRAEHMQATVRQMASSYRELLVGIGEDPCREGLLRTPERAAKALLYFTKGYDEKISGKCV